MRYARAYLPLVASALLFPATPSTANIILNGGFEENTATTTQINLSNASYNSIVLHSTAFGTGNEIDLWTGVFYPGIIPQSGNWAAQLNLAQGSSIDALSLSLDSSILAGSTYALQFFTSTGGMANIGISNSSTDPGTPIFSGSGIHGPEWIQHDYEFVAPHSAAFVTVWVSTGPFEHSVAIDSISLTQVVPEPTTGLLLGLGLLGVAVRRRV